jgi:uncharacterized membrane protein YkgB
MKYMFAKNLKCIFIIINILILFITKGKIKLFWFSNDALSPILNDSGALITDMS